ncbi:MAG: hypothetical protein JSV16_00830 [Candidatus Hydrogenedentota bacterium]|nr:MAG: hypothetical protein JSV16_00830 [Candidatus Hydrogenedentota bacterium]
MIDLHTHILPGMDDGPRQMEEALAMCRIAADDGITAVVASPHMFNGMFNVTRDDILAGVKRLSERIRMEAIPLAVKPGADVWAMPNLTRLLREGAVMTVGDRGKYLMVELPYDVLPLGLSQLLFSIQLQGITPILSHPERNLTVQADPLLMTGFVEAGNLVQLTAASVTGDFGEHAQKCAFALLAARLAHLIASDAHSPDKRPPGLSRALTVVGELLPIEEVDDIFLHRPLRVLAGEYVDLPEPIRSIPIKKRLFSLKVPARM